MLRFTAPSPPKVVVTSIEYDSADLEWNYDKCWFIKEKFAKLSITYSIKHYDRKFQTF